MGASNAVLNAICFAGVVTYLWRYFGFVVLISRNSSQCLQ